MADLLGAIANPQIADIIGALDYRQKRIQDDEERRKRIRTEQLAGKALSSGLVEGSTLYELASTNPTAYLTVAKSMGIDPADGSGVNQLSVDVKLINRLANAGDIQGAVDYMQSELDKRKSLGLNTGYLEKGLGAVSTDPHRFFNSVALLDRTFNPPKAEEGFTLKEGEKRFDSKGKEIASVAKSSSSNDIEGTANQKNWQEYQRLLASGDNAGAEQFGRASGFISSEGQKLSPFAEKQISESNDEYVSSSGAVGRYKSLAQKLRDATKLKSGLGGTWGEFIKEQTGNQDELTALRKEALAIANSEAINNLPPGTATDRDIELARAPFPTEKADPIYVANWLDAISRLNQKKAEYAEFKANFISQHGTVRDKNGNSMVSAWKELQQKNQGGSGKGGMTPGINSNVKPDSGGWSIKPVGQQ